jgi:ribonuclease P protein subunit RPR2
VFAVADVLDALTSDRPYRSASTMRVARQMIVAESGRQFDPGVVDAFESIDDLTFQLIAAEVG